MAAKKKAKKKSTSVKKSAVRPTAQLGGGAFEILSAKTKKPDPDGPWKPGEGWGQSGGQGEGTWLKAIRKLK